MRSLAPAPGRAESPQRASRRVLDLVLAVLPWVVFLGGGLVSLLAGSPESATESPQWLLVTAPALFFGLLVIRLAVTAARTPRRRLPSLVLAAALAAWACGSAWLTTSGRLDAIAFPSTAEVFFGPAYLLLVAFLLLDARRSSTATALWLDLVIVVGGAVCVLAFLLVTVLDEVFPLAGATLVLVLVYPMLALALSGIVAGQVALRLRPRSVGSLVLTAGFVALVAADILNAVAPLRRQEGASPSYGSNVVTEIAYGLAFTLLVEAACRSARPGSPAPAPARQRSGLIVAAAAVATAVLVLRPEGAGLWYVTAPAAATLVAAGARLVLALKQARDAAENQRLSLTDDLTGLPNRRAALAALQRGLRGRAPLGLLLLDLDGFKDVNDSLGHVAGDAVLREVGERLPKALPPSTVVARLGGDEFALVVPRDDPKAMLALAHRAQESLAAPLRVAGLDIAMRSSVGITARQEGDEAAEDLLRRADVAMYEAKAARAGAVLYDGTRDLFNRDRLELAEQLRTGIASGQLVVWYQPQVDARTMHVTGAEALVRWQHPTLGLVAPIEFLPLARRSGLMGSLTDAVMAQVVQDAADWARRGTRLRVSMNCAPPELLGTTLLPKLFAAIREAGLPPESLLIEVTEDSFVNDPELARDVLKRLREHHVQTAIDDYGTGFSSLAYLRDLPVQELKIDRSFVSTMHEDPRSRVIVDSTRQMAHAMGMRLVAEGVEDLETVRELTVLDIDVLQGYHISPPMPVGDFSRWLGEWERDRPGPAADQPAA